MEKSESPKTINIYEFLFKSYERYMFFSQTTKSNNAGIRFKFPPPDKFLSLNQGMVFKAHDHFSSLAPGFWNFTKAIFENQL